MPLARPLTVSISAAEMSDRIERIAEEAGQLAGTSASLRSLVASFRLDATPAVVGRRRSDDWELLPRSQRLAARPAHP